LTPCITMQCLNKDRITQSYLQLKGMSWSEAGVEADNYIDQLNLEAKRNVAASNLSGINRLI
jgi:ABC-type polar amino acid transport system ATPase subunit